MSSPTVSMSERSSFTSSSSRQWSNTPSTTATGATSESKEKPLCVPRLDDLYKHAVRVLDDNKDYKRAFVLLSTCIYTYSEEPGYRLTRARCAFSLRLYSTTLKDARQALDSLRGRRAAMDETLHALSPTLRRGVAQHNAQQYLEGFRWLVKGLIAKGNFSEETFKALEEAKEFAKVSQTKVEQLETIDGQNKDKVCAGEEGQFADYHCEVMANLKFCLEARRWGAGRTRAHVVDQNERKLFRSEDGVSEGLFNREKFCQDRWEVARWWKEKMECLYGCEGEEEEEEQPPF